MNFLIRKSEVHIIFCLRIWNDMVREKKGITLTSLDIRRRYYKLKLKLNRNFWRLIQNGWKNVVTCYCCGNNLLKLWSLLFLLLNVSTLNGKNHVLTCWFHNKQSQTIARLRFLSLDNPTSDVDKFSLPITSHFEYGKLFFYYINYRYLNWQRVRPI